MILHQSHLISHTANIFALVETTTPSLNTHITMPVRVPRLPAAKPSEIFCMGAAGVGVLTPLYLVMPGAEERLSNQTNKWAPRWERNVSYFIPPMEKGVQRIEPPVSKMVQRVEDRLPLECRLGYAVTLRAV